MQDRGGSREYHRRVRRVTKQLVGTGKEPPKPQEVVNDYDYSDYRFRVQSNRDRRI